MTSPATAVAILCVYSYGVITAACVCYKEQQTQEADVQVHQAACLFSK